VRDRQAEAQAEDDGNDEDDAQREVRGEVVDDEQLAERDGQVQEFCKSIVSERCSSASRPMNHRKRKNPVMPNQTDMIVVGDAD